jgi:uncharacterized protein (TIGR02996 family)
MSEKESLLAAIYANPKDDTVRLAFADWLDEHGEAERAEFIRIQIERARVTDNNLRLAELWKRKEALLGEYSLAWLGDLIKVAPADAWSFYRGFPDALIINSATINDEGAVALANSHHLANLTSLDLAYNLIGEAGVMALANSTHLSNLTYLDLTENLLGNSGAVALANSPHLTKLTDLRLRYNEIGDTGAVALANSTHLTNLSRLDLERNEIGDAGAKALRARFGDAVKLSQLPT